MNPKEQRIREILEETLVGGKPLGQNVIDEIIFGVSLGSIPEKGFGDAEVLSNERIELEKIRDTASDWRRRAQAAARIISLGL